VTSRIARIISGCAIFCLGSPWAQTSPVSADAAFIGRPLGVAAQGSNSIVPPRGSDVASASWNSLLVGATRDPLDLSKAVGVLERTENQPIAVTRGAKEAAIYTRISPAVVLIVNNDSLGSGSVVSTDGLVLTNLHVVGKAREVGVIYKPAVEGGEITQASLIRGTVIKIDQVADLALIQVASVRSGTTPITFGNLANVEVGADVHAIGHPTGEAWTYTRGIVSQIRRNYEWKTDDGFAHHADVVQTQTPINPGNSGGPLLNDSGELIGVNSFKAEGEGLNFAIAVDEVQRFIASPQSRFAAALQTKPPAPQATAASKDCIPRKMATRRDNDPPSNVTQLDLNCSGRMDGELYEPDDTSKPNMLIIDTKGTGKGDIVMFDNGRKGWFDSAFYDTVGDGKPHLIGYFHKGEDKPYKVEPYTASGK